MEKQKNGIGLRMWLFVILIGFAGQMAWAIENMYLNTYITYLNFSSPAGQGFDYSFFIAITTAASAIVATLTTLFMGALTDKVGHKKEFISIGYILWGIATASFGLFNVNSKNSILPIAISSSMAAVFVIIIDCVMTFFGSTSNDAAFNSYVTKNIPKKSKGKVEGVLQILPLIAMLVIFVCLNGLTTDSSTGANDAKWDLFFYLIGGLVVLMGIISFFLIPKREEEKTEKSYLSQLTEGFRISTIKKNSKLYVILLIYFIYATATQVFFPYLMVYLERTCQISNTGTGLTDFAIVMAIALLLGSLLSVVIGFLSDNLGKNKMILPIFVLFAIGILMMFFIPNISNETNARTVYAAIAGTIMILGYVGIPTVINALVRENIPAKDEGIFMGVRMLFVVALPMCIGPFIGDALNSSLGSTYTNSFGDTSAVPSQYGYLVGLGILVLAIVPILIYFHMEKKGKKNHGYLLYGQVDVKMNPDEIPLSEYPRPSFKRDSYLNLDGMWEFMISKYEKLPEKYVDRVMVPYAIESVYSMVNHLMEPDEILYYHRKVSLPMGFRKKKTIIHFEGVDEYCEVYIDDKLICSHHGGFTSFDVEIPDEVKDEFSLTLKVKDQTNASYHTRGKQVLDVTGYYYSSSSGVYKPIWIESLEEKHIENIVFTPDYDHRAIKVRVNTKEDGKAKLVFHQREYEVDTNVENTISLEGDFHPWSDKDPYLYDVDVFYYNDSVSTYFAIRKIEIKEINGVKRILLNNEPIYISGLLDQGYYFLGNYTPRNYDEYLFDIRKTKEMGFNCLRKHIKTELDVFYYYCDREGMLLIQDFPCGGDKYSFFWCVIPRVFASMNEKNLTDKRMARTSEEGKKEFLHECDEYLGYYHNHPSVIIYSIFNEGWGEFSPSAIYHDLKAKEDSKLFDTASGWYDADSDFYSIHTYTFPDMKRKDKRNRPFIISEMGGASLKVEGHSYFDGFFGHGKAKDEEDLKNKYVDLYENKIKKQIKDGLNMTIYTEIADCETEYNGIFTYDRKVQKIPSDVLCKVNEDLYSELRKYTK
jgi:MFS family permease